MSRFIDIPGNPVPSGGKAFDFAAEDGAVLRGALFPVDNAKASILLLTGWTEFIEKYFETISDLQARGFNVAMMDWRGQGLSDRLSAPEMGWSGYFQQLADDIRFFTEQYVKKEFAAPRFLMTHSMGGLPALLLLANGYDGFERATLCAPMTQLFDGPANVILGGLSGFLKTVGLAGAALPAAKDHAQNFEGNIFTSDEDRHRRFRDLQAAEPMAIVKGPTFGWVADAMKQSAALRRPGFFQELKTPVRIISAGAEQQINGADHHVIAALSPLIECVEIPNALHEIMMERDELRTLYWRAFEEFTAPVLEGA